MAHVCHGLARACTVNPDGVATVEYASCDAATRDQPPRLTSWREFHRAVQALYTRLRARLGATPTSKPRVAILAGNGCGMLQSLYAIAAAGAIAVPLNVRWEPAELASALSDTTPQLFLADEAQFSKAEAAVSQCAWPVALEPLAMGQRELLPEELLHEELGELVVSAEEPSDAATSGVAFILFTSGTSGKAKGVVITHAMAVCQAMAKVCAPVGIAQDSVFLSVVPLFHIGGISTSLAVTMMGGTHVFSPPNSKSARSRPLKSPLLYPLVDSLARIAVNTLVVVPTMLHMVTSELTRMGRRLPNIRLVLVGGGSLSALPSLFQEAKALMPGAVVVQTYACTEAGSSVTFGLLTEAVLTLGGAACFAGQPVPHAEIRIRLKDDESRYLSKEAVGEILTRGPHVTPGYWRGPDVPCDSSRIRNGWLHTGDLGYIGAGGNLFFSGRLSDVIKTGGENVNAFEVEDLLRVFEAPQGSSLAGLRLCAAAVVGLPDLRLGEQVCAVVTVSPEDFRRVAERQGVSGDPEFLHDSELHRLLRNHLRSGGLAAAAKFEWKGSEAASEEARRELPQDCWAQKDAQQAIVGSTLEQG
eukprot:scaffold34_cov260-Pinguiococcus_pyrenoidosus.AAC.40